MFLDKFQFLVKLPSNCCCTRQVRNTNRMKLDEDFIFPQERAERRRREQVGHQLSTYLAVAGWPRCLLFQEQEKQEKEEQLKAAARSMRPEETARLFKPHKRYIYIYYICIYIYIYISYLYIYTHHDVFFH